jgi:hypothetical protein
MSDTSSRVRSSPASATGVLDKARRAVPSDLLTVASLAVLAYAASNVLHEGLGHGGACLLVGGVPRLLTSVSFECDTTGLAPTASRVLAAAGTVVNLAAGTLAALAYRRASSGTAVSRYFLWLFATINFLQAFGYFLFSGVGRIGDWAVVMAPIQPAWAWRIGLAAVGGALYWIATNRAFRALGRFIDGRSSDRFPIGQRLALVSYATGGALYLVSGLLNPAGPLLLAVSAAAASLGGTSGLAWGPQLLRGQETGSSSDVPTRVPRDMRIVVAAAAVGLSFIFLLGPGVPLG